MEVKLAYLMGFWIKELAPKSQTFWMYILVCDVGRTITGILLNF